MELKKLNKTYLAAALTLIFGLPMVAQAQEAGFSAEVDSRLTYDDNILRTSEANAQSDTSLVVAPELQLAGILGKQRFAVTYNGEYAKYQDNTDVNYTDHDIRLRADFDHSYRLTSGFDLQYKDKHEDFGEVNSISNGLSEFHRYNETQINGKFAYGRQDSFGQLVFRLGRTDIEYDNNNQNYRSHERDLASLGFYYRIAPRTRLLAEVEYQKFDYNPDVGFLDLDNEYIRYRVGLEWALTNQLEGMIKVGYQDRDYKIDVLRDIDGLSYEADLEYKPNTYTTIGLLARRESIDSSLESAGGFLRTTFGVSLIHGFTERTKLDGQVGYSKDDLVFLSINSDRKDKREFAKLGVLHDLLTWVEIGANISFENRKSNLEDAKFEVNSINLTAKLLLN